MLTLTANQKYILEELEATFVSAFIKNAECPGGSHRVRIVSNDNNENILAEASDVDEQKALDEAIEKARDAAGVNDHKIGEKEALEIRLTKQQSQIDALLEQNKQLMGMVKPASAPEPATAETGLAIPTATLPPPPPIKNKGGRPRKNTPSPEPEGQTDDGN